MNLNSLDIVPTPEEYENCPLTRYLFETSEGCKTTMEWFSKIDDDSLMMIVDCAEMINDLDDQNTNQITDSEYDEEFWNFHEDDLQNPFNPYADGEFSNFSVSEPSLLDIKRSVYDYAMLAANLCEIELRGRGFDTQKNGISENILSDSIQYLALWAVFEQLRRKGLVEINGDGFLSNHSTTFFKLTHKGELVSQFIKLQSLNKNAIPPVEIMESTTESEKPQSDLLTSLNEIAAATSNVISDTTCHKITTTTTTRSVKRSSKKSNKKS